MALAPDDVDPGVRGSVLITGARLVPVTTPAPEGEVDVRITEGVVSEVAPRLRAGAEKVVAADGRWVIPGLWDHHVHVAQWALARHRLDLAPARSVEDALRIVAAHVATLPAGAETVVQGWGHRSAMWSRRPTVPELDAVSRSHLVVLVSGDGHHAWLNSRALALLGLPARDGVVEERVWFEAYPRLAAMPGAQTLEAEAVRQAVVDAAAKGIVGIVDLESDACYRDWPQRVADGIDQVRVRASCYPERLDDAIRAGLRSGDPLPGGAALVTMGPLKIISDGSLNTRTAYCCERYADAGDLDRPRGVQNYPPHELAALLGRATGHGLEVAVHALGDAAIDQALTAVEQTGAHGSLEHLQLIRREDIPRLAALGLRASMQPAHLLDDRDVTMQCWPDRHDRCFAFASLARAGVPLALGSDAPVAPLDPWLAMAAAVHRSSDDRPPWNQAEALTARQALAASTDGQGTIAPGSRGDVALLDDDPLAPSAATADSATRLRGMSCAATVVSGRVVTGQQSR